MPKIKSAVDFVKQISQSGLSIYDPIEVGHSKLWIPSPELELLINKELLGRSLGGLPIRTRSKVVKTGICKALGYPVPLSFKRTKPRFLGQLFDVYVQKSNNLQIWNESLSATRRYVLIQVSGDDVITDVRVVTGEDLAFFDRTGTLTQKYQARFIKGDSALELVTSKDTANLKPLLSSNAMLKLSDKSPIAYPEKTEILPISEVFKRLSSLVGNVFADAGIDQERNRGAELHRLVCKSLGFIDYADDGRFPDVRQQLLEVKLQTAPTIDLGLVLPNSTGPLDLSQIDGHQIRHRDVRYVVFGAQTDGKSVTITNLVLSTGESFFKRFQQFQGNVLNRKLQMRLPDDFFRTKAK